MSSRSRLLWLLLALMLGGGAGFAVLQFERSLAPDPAALGQLESYRPPLSSVVLDRNGRTLGEFYVQRRRLVSRDQVPDHVVHAFVAAEDRRFFDHGGVDYPAMLRAAWTNLRVGRVAQGASTITQQLVKNVLLTPERSWRRKLREILLARRVERELTKQEILLLYLNHIYFGSGAYGIAEAARTYFDEDVSELSVSEAALLAGLPQRPSAYSPTRNGEASEMRRRYVLGRMRELGFLSADQHREALGKPPRLATPRERDQYRIAAYFTEEVRQAVERLLGPERLHRDGLIIETSLDLDLQRTAWRAVREGLEALEARRGVLPDPAHGPEPEGALVSLEIGSGDVLALVGGYDFERSEFNRAIQAHRQPGSAFKPFVYAAALEAGYTQASLLLDSPTSLWDAGTGGVWRPRNYSRRFLGWITLRQALSRSVNNASIRLLQRVGERHVVDVARRLGIRSPLAQSPSLALGTSDVTLLELVRAYAAFPAGGIRVPARFIRRVLDQDGRLLLEDVPLDWRELVEAREFGEEPPATGMPALDPAVAGVMTDLLRAAVRDPGATGGAARSLGAVGGKTGTTNAYEDAWFVGFSPAVATGVWVGFDRPQPLGPRETGSRAALPIWTAYMHEAIERFPVQSFPIPEGVAYALVDPATGRLSNAANPRASLQVFVDGTQPRVWSRAEVRLSRRDLLLDF